METEEIAEVECVDCQNDTITEGVIDEENDAVVEEVIDENEYALGYILGAVVGTSVLGAIVYLTTRYIHRSLKMKLAPKEENTEKAED